MAYRKSIKLFICLPFMLTALNANAQIAILQNTIDKLESYKNFSYQSVSKKKELFTSDTVTEQHNALFAKATGDKNFGYLFNIETLNENDKLTYSDVYNGQDLIKITPRDSTYAMQDIHAFIMQSTLPGCLKWIQGRLEKKTSKIEKTNDTTINGIDSYHLIANVYDTIIDKQHNYTYAHLCIDKLSGMPDCVIIKSRNTTYGNGVSDYYSETCYFDYKFNQNNMDIASMTAPKGFHMPKEQPKEQSALLASGTVAPGWSLYTAEGKKVSLTEMKGKVILLDFYFISCFPCMQSIKPLNKLYEKYKNQNVIIASITGRDNEKSVLAFDKNYKIKYPGYVNAADVVKLYHVDGFPTFYFIDKEGKIANVIVGYTDDFEEKVSAIIDNLLKKS